MWLPDHSVRGRERPGIIYHYTTTNGLIGILESNELWATDLNYMNDASELIYARELIAEVIAAKLTATVDPILMTFYERAVRMQEPGSRGFYGVCFCEDGDLLSQWRAYGDRGGGYAIGLHAAEIGLGSEPPLCIRKTVYDPIRQRDLVEVTLDRTEHVLMELTRDVPAEAGDSIIPIVLHFLDDHLSEYTYTFKNEAFREEQEWRVVLPILPYERNESRRLMRFRNSAGMLAPYILMNVSPTAGVNTGRIPIARIVFGPTVDRRLTREALKDLLAKHGFPHVEVVPSDIPLRR